MMANSEYDEELIDIEELDGDALDIRNYFPDPNVETTL